MFPKDTQGIRSGRSPGEDEPSDDAPRLTASALSGLGRDGDQDRVDMLLDKA